MRSYFTPETSPSVSDETINDINQFLDFSEWEADFPSDTNNNEESPSTLTTSANTPSSNTSSDESSPAQPSEHIENLLQILKPWLFASDLYAQAFFCIDSNIEFVAKIFTELHSLIAANPFDTIYKQQLLQLIDAILQSEIISLKQLLSDKEVLFYLQCAINTLNALQIIFSDVNTNYLSAKNSACNFFILRHLLAEVSRPAEFLSNLELLYLIPITPTNERFLIETMQFAANIAQYHLSGPKDSLIDNFTRNMKSIYTNSPFIFSTPRNEVHINDSNCHDATAWTKPTTGFRN